MWRTRMGLGLRDCLGRIQVRTGFMVAKRKGLGKKGIPGGQAIESTSGRTFIYRHNTKDQPSPKKKKQKKNTKRRIKENEIAINPKSTEKQPV